MTVARAAQQHAERHQSLLQAVVLLIAVGVTLVTGGWNHFLVWLRVTFDFGGGTLL